MRIQQLIVLGLFALLVIVGIVVYLMSGDNRKTIKINFQCRNKDVPKGYLPDYGELYHKQHLSDGTSLEYGWDCDLTAAANPNTLAWNLNKHPGPHLNSDGSTQENCGPNAGCREYGYTTEKTAGKVTTMSSNIIPDRCGGCSNADGAFWKIAVKPGKYKVQLDFGSLAEFLTGPTFETIGCKLGAGDSLQDLGTILGSTDASKGPTVREEILVVTADKPYIKYGGMWKPNGQGCTGANAIRITPI
jgi:hypothetical protein